jgi:hypothetical protein
MKKIILILLLFLPISCQWEDESVCFKTRQSRDIKVPFLLLDSLIVFITSDYYEQQKKIELPLNNILLYNYITDSITIKKTDLIGTPLKIFKNKNDDVVVLTSKCIYSINKNYDLILENKFNFNNNDKKFKTLYDWVDDNIIIMPGIDNQDRNIYKINTTDFSYELFNNIQLNMYKNELVDFVFPKSISNIDFIFTNGSKYFIVKDNNKIEKSLTDNNQILSLSYNYFDNEICIGTTNGCVYFDDLTQLRKNVLKNGFEFPNFLCNDENVSSINFENNFFQIFQNNNLHSSYHFSFDKNLEGAKDIGNFKNIEQLIVPINNRKNEEEGYSSLILINNELLHSFAGNALFEKGIDGKIIPSLTINYNKKTVDFDRRGGNVKTKKINYKE